jgi:hypothetical protein
LDEDGNAEISDETPADPQDSDCDGEADDPYKLFPDELQRELDAQASELDRSVQNDEEKPECIREAELLDDLIERGDGEPVGTLFDEPVKFPRPEQLDDEQVETALKGLLAQLALYGIALDVCEHFTPRDAYRLLVEEICPNQTAYPELRNTRWIQHFSTWEHCDACDAEMDKKLADEEQRRKAHPPNDTPNAPDQDDGEIPF